MTIQHLKIFIAVVEHGTMHKAAEKLFVSQPSISQAISELEIYYNVRLFERITQRLYLTDKGKELLPYAKHAVDAFETMDELMRNSGVGKRLRIGASVTIGTCLLNQYISELEDEIPGIEVDAQINNTSLIEQMIKNCTIDIGLVEGMINDKDIICKQIQKDELVLVTGQTHPLYTKSNVNVEDLQDQPFISREEGSVDRNQFENFLKENKISIKRQWVCSNTEAIKNAVISGRGLAIISSLMIKKEVAEGSLKVLPINDMKLVRDFQLIYHKNKYISAELSKLIDICCKS